MVDGFNASVADERRGVENTVAGRFRETDYLSDTFG